jgi:hypothetical protein
MNTLNATKKIQVVLSGAVNTNQCPVTASWRDEQTGNQMGGVNIPRKDSTSVVTAGATAVDLIAASGDNSVVRTITGITFFNKDVAAVTATIQEVDSLASTTREVYKVVLQTGEQFFYTEGIGFEAQDVNGAVKSQAAATSSATSTAQATASAASVSISSLAAAVNPTSVNSVSSQASSIAAAIVPASINSVSSQASSMAALVPASTSSAASNYLASQASINSTSSQASSMQNSYSTVLSTVSRTKSSFGW